MLIIKWLPKNVSIFYYQITNTNQSVDIGFSYYAIYNN